MSQVILDNFYNYLNESINLPSGYIIGKDCVHKHGIRGKTIRKRVKGSNFSNCDRCRRNTAIKAESTRYKKKGKRRNLDALNACELREIDKDPFDF